MGRFAIKLSYDGTAYHGWQIQPNAISIQAKLNEALRTLFRQNIETIGAGRTDTGVHAEVMYAHFDLSSNVDEVKDAVYQLNSLLPKDIAIQSLVEVDESFHARFDANKRSYIYRMHKTKNPFLENRSWYHPFDLNVSEMNEACNTLKTYSDFSCFSKSNTQTKTNNCKIESASWTEIENGRLEFRISADRFLRNMVRAIVGTMIEIGKGQMNEKEFRKVLESGDRGKAGTSVPACGLYLSEITYPKSKLA